MSLCLKTAPSKLPHASLLSSESLCIAAHSHCCSGWARTAFVRTLQAEQFSSQTGSRWILKMDSSVTNLRTHCRKARRCGGWLADQQCGWRGSKSGDIGCRFSLGWVHPPSQLLRFWLHQFNTSKITVRRSQ